MEKRTIELKWVLYVIFDRAGKQVFESWDLGEAREKYDQLYAEALENRNLLAEYRIQRVYVPIVRNEDGWADG